MLSNVKLQYLTCQLQSERLFVKCVLDTAHWKWPAQGTSTVPIVSAHFRSLFVTMTWLYFAIGKFASYFVWSVLCACTCCVSALPVVVQCTSTRCVQSAPNTRISREHYFVWYRGDFAASVCSMHSKNVRGCHHEHRTFGKTFGAACMGQLQTSFGTLELF